MVVRTASVTFTNAYVAVYYWKFCWCSYPASPLCLFVEGARFEVSLPLSIHTIVLCPACFGGLFILVALSVHTIVLCPACFGGLFILVALSVRTIVLCPACFSGLFILVAHLGGRQSRHIVEAHNVLPNK
jgi:hypothetical protein